MKAIIVSSTAALVIFGWTSAARASDMEIGVDMTPMGPEVVVVAKKSDDRFANYALENAAAGGQ